MKNNILLRTSGLMLILFIASCAPQRIRLSKEENKLQKQMQVELNCQNFEFRHDYEAITGQRSDGAFYVTLCDSCCKMDSTELKKTMIKVIIKT